MARSDGWFKPGQSGNPAGQFKPGADDQRHDFTPKERSRGLRRQQMTKKLTNALNTKLDEAPKNPELGATNAEAVANAVVSGTISGDAAMAKLLFDRTEGAVAQKIELTNPDVFAAFGQAMAELGYTETQYVAITDLATKILDPHAIDPSSG